jgi:uncharacterized protein YPO0396
MPTVKTEIDFEDILRMQCEELGSPPYASRFHLNDITDWCYKLLDRLDYQGMYDALFEIIDRIEKAQSPADSESFKEALINKVAKNKIETMQAEIDKLTAELERSNSLVDRLTIELDRKYEED